MISSFFLSLASASVPQSPTLKINGFTVIELFSIHQGDKNNGKFGPPHLGVDVSNLYFSITGISTTDLKYGYNINLASIPNNDVYIDQNYAFFKYKKFGEILIGSVAGPDDAMSYNSSKIIGGCGGFDGGYGAVYNKSAGALTGDDSIGTPKKNNKIIWYSPEVMGFRVGIAYTPHTSRSGSEKYDSNLGGGQEGGNDSSIYPLKRENGPFGLNNWSGGISFHKSNRAWRFAIAASGILERSYYTETSSTSQTRYGLRHTKSYKVSGQLGYCGWDMGLGFADNGKSRLPTDPNFTIRGINAGDLYYANSGKAYDAGLSYTYGPYKVATAYQHTKRRTGPGVGSHAKFDMLSLTGDVSVFQGLKFFGETSFIKSRTNARVQQFHQRIFDAIESKRKIAVGNNNATMVAIGTKISF